MSALLQALGTLVVVAGILSLIEWQAHKLRHNPDKNYWWGVWLFSLLAAVYVYISALGH